MIGSHRSFAIKPVFVQPNARITGRDEKTIYTNNETTTLWFMPSFG